MNILMLGWELPPYNTGGLGVACYHMSKALAIQGANIDFVVPYSAIHPGSEFMNVHCATGLLPYERFELGAYDHPILHSDPLSEADTNDLRDMHSVQDRYVKYVEKLVRITKPDIIHAHDWLTIRAGMRAKEITDSPLIVHVHATEFDRSGSISGNPLIHEIEYEGLTMADRIVAVSQITKDLIVQKYNIPADKIEVIHNSIDLDSFNDGHEYDKRTYKYLEAMKQEGYTVVLCLGRLTIQKGLSHLIRAISKASEKYDKILLLIIGEGDQRNDLIEFAADLGISDKIFFAGGFFGGKQKRDAYAGSDIFVLSSVSEPFGLTALEAAHYGNALIITKQSGVGEVLNSVFKYDFWDIDLLADQLIGIATSSALRNSLQQNVQYEYSRISWHDVAAKCLKMYNLQIGAGS